MLERCSGLLPRIIGTNQHWDTLKAIVLVMRNHCGRMVRGVGDEAALWYGCGIFDPIFRDAYGVVNKLLSL